MKLGLLGDIHAEDERLAAALRTFSAEGVGRVLFVGDVADGQGDLDRCCALLTDAKAIGVRGNHDRWMLEGSMRSLSHAHHRVEVASQSVALLASLPPTREIDTPLGPLLLCHGVGDNDMKRLTQDDEGYALETNDELTALIQANRYALVIGGHTHERMVKRFDSLVFINAGSLARSSNPCCGILDCTARAVTFFDLEDAESPLRAETLLIP
jgi:predicted phosphodiesterase